MIWSWKVLAEDVHCEEMESAGGMVERSGLFDGGSQGGFSWIMGTSWKKDWRQVLEKGS